jgi:hypothetical protein
MTTYRTRDGAEYPRYEKFTIKWVATLFWVPLEIAPNRVRYFESSQLTEVVDPRLTGMVYCYPAIPQNFDSGLNYCFPLPYVKPVIVCLPADMLGKVGGGKGKNKRPTIPGVDAAESLHVLVIAPVSLFAESMRAA